MKNKAKSLFVSLCALLAAFVFAGCQDVTNAQIVSTLANRAATVTFDAQGGTCDTQTLAVKFGATIEELPIPSKSGWNFSGWYTSTNGAGIQLTTSTAIEDSFTVYAYYTAVSTQITSLTLDTTSLSVESGEGFTITGTYSPAYSNENIIITSSNGQIVRVDNSNATKNNGTFTAYFHSCIKGSATITIRNSSNTVSRYCSVAVTQPATETLPVLEVKSGKSNNINDFELIQFTSTYLVASYAINMEAGTPYTIQCADSRSWSKAGLSSNPSGFIDCYFYLYKDGIQVAYTDDGGYINYTPTSNCTCILTVRAYNVGNSGKGAVRVYTNIKISSLSANSTTVNAPLGSSYPIAYTYAPQNAGAYTWQVSLGDTNYLYYPSSYSATNGTANIYVNSRRIGSSTVTVKDTVSNLTAETVTVNITADKDAATPLTIGNRTSSTASDYTFVTLNNENPYKLYSVNLTKGKQYLFQYLDNENKQGTTLTDVGNCDFTLYDDSLNYLNYYSNGTCTYTAPSTGTYYLAITRAYNTSPTYTAKGGVRVWIKPDITAITPASTNVTIPLGKAYSLVYNYEPDNAAYNWSTSIGNTNYLSRYNSTNTTGAYTLDLRALRVGSTTVNLKDNISNISANTVTFNITADKDTATPLTIGNAPSSNSSDYSFVTIDNENSYKLYSINLTAGKQYSFQFVDTVNNQSTNESDLGNCDFALYDASLNCLYYYSSGTLTYTASSTGTYYLAVTRYYYNSSTYTAKGGVRVWMKPDMTAITASTTTLNLTLGQAYSLDYNYSPEYAAYSWSSSIGNTNYLSNYNTTNPTTSSVSLDLRARRIGSTYVDLKDSLTNIAADRVTVNISADKTTATPLTIGNGISSNASDFIFTTIDSTNTYKLYSVNLTAGETYTFQYVDTGNNQGTEESGLGNCEFVLYDNDLNCLYYNDSGTRTYTPSTAGTYYVAMTRYYWSSSTYTAKGGVRVFTPVKATALTLSEPSLTLASGETKTLTVSPTPSNADTSYSISTNDNSRIASATLSGSTITVKGLVAGSTSCTISEGISGKSITLNIAVTIDTSTITRTLPIGTAPSSNATDYETVSLSDSKPAEYFKVDLEANKTYYFQCADSDKNPDIGLSVSDCYFFLYDSSFTRLKAQDYGTISYKPTTSGTYYFAITRYSQNGNRTGAVHAYTTD